jgi:hypothetical protein
MDFPSNQRASLFPNCRKRLIPGRVQSTVHATFLSLFLNGEELEMNSFTHFVAAFMSSTGTVSSSSSNRN